MPLPTIPSGNVGSATASTGFNVANSLRFNRADEAILTRTQSTSPTHDDKCTMSFWFKQGSQSATASRGFAVFGGDDANNRAFFYIETDGQLYYYGKLGGSANITINSNAMYRDSSAWYHYCLAIDTTQGTAANRIRTYINGVEVTSYVSASYPSQNDNMPFVKGADMMIGSTRGGSYQLYGWAECYMSEVHFVDGQQLTPSSFTEYDEDSPTILKPKDCKADLTYGTNGFYLEFKGTGTSADSSGMGADTSGNDNHLAATNLAAVDQATDTPTNNFCTGNVLDNYYQSAAYTEGNCVVLLATSVQNYSTATMGMTAGKWYWEIQGTTNTGGFQVLPGIAGRMVTSASEQELGEAADTYAYYSTNGNSYTGGSGSSYGDTFAADDIISVAVDLDNNKLYFAKNGTWQNSGDPTSGATGTGAISISAASATTMGLYLPAWTGGWGGSVGHYGKWNFGGCPGFAISSGNADGNGYGNFEYAPPSGYLSLCSKNLGSDGG